LPENLEEVERLSTGRVRDIISRFKGRIDIWDVVNEPTDLTRFSNPMNTWAKQLGGVPFTALHLKVARSANPDATLLVNDYRTDPPYFDILNGLRIPPVHVGDQGGGNGKLPFDAIGIQSHMHGGGWKLERIWEVCDNYSWFGVPIHFTETTIVSGARLPSPNRGGEGGGVWGPTTPEGEAAQADYVPQFYTMLFAHPAVQAVTWWDFSDDGAWQDAPAGWLRKDMSPKPVYERLMELIKGEWWTKTEGHTNAHGEFHSQAFYGTHRLIAQLPNGSTVTKDVHWERGKVNRFELIVE
jgi:GH35 family endo-1,4-beta-xylanase